MCQHCKALEDDYARLQRLNQQLGLVADQERQLRQSYETLYLDTLTESRKPVQDVLPLFLQAA